MKKKSPLGLFHKKIALHIQNPEIKNLIFRKNRDAWLRIQRKLNNHRCSNLAICQATIATSSTWSTACSSSQSSRASFRFLGRPSKDFRRTQSIAIQGTISAPSNMLVTLFLPESWRKGSPYPGFCPLGQLPSASSWSSSSSWTPTTRARTCQTSRIININIARSSIFAPAKSFQVRLRLNDCPIENYNN